MHTALRSSAPPAAADVINATVSVLPTAIINSKGRAVYAVSSPVCTVKCTQHTPHSVDNPQTNTALQSVLAVAQKCLAHTNHQG